MLKDRLLFSMSDVNPCGTTLLKSIDKAFEANEKQQGIFWTVNAFSGTSRKNDECRKILAWAIDIDPAPGEEKPDLMARILAGPRPTSVIESGRGYHVYFDADKSATTKNYTKIVEQMVKFYLGDPKAKDIARLLRVPGFLHWKDPGNPKPVRLLRDFFHTNHVYSEKDMMILFPQPQVAVVDQQEKRQLKKVLSFQKDSQLFERIYSMNCKEGLERLSGHPAVSMETFSFRRTTNGNQNILVNGKGTSCWIDKNNRIGSGDGGGPTLWQFINWYHKDHKKTHQFFKEVFPEVFT